MITEVPLNLSANYREAHGGFPAEIAILANGYTIYSFETNAAPGAQPGAAQDLILEELWEHLARLAAQLRDLRES